MDVDHKRGFVFATSVGAPDFGRPALDQVILGSNPSTPANAQALGVARCTQASKREPWSDAIRYWERRRVFYNLVLVTIVLAWVIITWPHFSESLTLQSLLFLVIFASMANLFYSAAYLVDIPLQHSPFKTVWPRWRLGLWLIGTLFAILFTNYWIADEIYPYVR